MLHPPCLSWRWWAPLLIVIIFETRVCAQTVVYQDWRGDDTMDVGSGWKLSSWFGYFYDESFPWIYHETQGWLYSESVSSESVWFWDQNIGWIWTSDESYPYLFIYETSAWVTDLGDVRLTEKEETAKTLDTLVSENSDAARALIDEIVGHKDIRYIAVFIELMRAQEVFIQVAIDRTIIIDTLEALSGENFGSNWAAWVEWYGLTDLAPPSGFTSWKGRLLSNIDPEFGDFLSDDFPSRIRTEEILWGGVLVDGIPPLDNPKRLLAEAATYLEPTDLVFGISINGDARAYPLRIMDWHEMANEVIGGVPVSLAYCTLCGAAIAYDGRVAEGITYNFGTSGFLFRSNKLMYDRQTRTLWNQFTGKPVLGTLAGTDLRLSILPLVLTDWASWQERNPHTTVLDIDTGYSRPYANGRAYGSYFGSPETLFPVAQRRDLLDTKDQIYALEIEGIPKAYPIETLTEEQVVNDIIGDTPVVLIAQSGIATVDFVETPFPLTYSAGAEVRAYNRGELNFNPGLNAGSVIDSEGQVWSITEEALISEEGIKVPRINGHLAYWFGWYAFFPNTLVYGIEDE